VSRPPPDVLVVGGGVVGCAVAFFLAREGFRTLLLEERALASGASGAAAGMLAPIGEGFAPGPLLRLGLASLGAFPALCAELRERGGIDPEYEPSGILRIARDAAEVEGLRASMRAVAAACGDALGLAWLGHDEARRLVPCLAPSIAGAVLSPREGHVRSPVLARAYAAAAVSLGAEVETGVRVEGFVREGARVVGARTAEGVRAAGAIVLCAGAWSAAPTEGLGARALPIEPVRGQILRLEPPPGVAAPGPILWGGTIYLVAKRDGSLSVGATEERVGFDCRVTADGVAALAAGARSLVPSLGQATFRDAWAGLRPALPDRLPAIGAWPGLDGLFVATGHHRNGVLLSPETGRLVTDLVRGKALPPDARELSLERLRL
jgi:glycine oxidase